MAKRLPWFPFYVNDFIDNERVLALNNEQRGIYLWLLCRQWMLGSLPYDVGDVYALMPPNTNTAATSFVFLAFFPADPDTNRRRNPRLEVVRQEQEATAEANRARTAKARASVTKAVTRTVTATKTEPETKTEEDVAGRRLPIAVWNAGLPYFTDRKTRLARVGEVEMLLGGMRGLRVSPEAVARGLSDMASAGAKFTSIAVKRFAERAVKLLEGEAGQRAAQSPVLGRPDANQTPLGGWSEDEVEG